jgi:hypothetical protein
VDGEVAYGSKLHLRRAQTSLLQLQKIRSLKAVVKGTVFAIFGIQ